MALAVSHRPAIRVVSRTTHPGKCTTETYMTNGDIQTKVVLHTRPEVRAWGIWSMIYFSIFAWFSWADPTKLVAHGYGWAIHLLPLAAWGIAAMVVVALTSVGLIWQRPGPLRVALALQMFFQFTWAVSLLIYTAETGADHRGLLGGAFNWLSGMVVAAFLLRRSFFTRTKA